MGYRTWTSILANLAWGAYLNKANLFPSFSTEKALNPFIFMGPSYSQNWANHTLKCVAAREKKIKKMKPSNPSKTTPGVINAVFAACRPPLIARARLPLTARIQCQQKDRGGLLAAHSPSAQQQKGRHTRLAAGDLRQSCLLCSRARPLRLQTACVQ